MANGYYICHQRVIGCLTLQYQTDLESRLKHKKKLSCSRQLAKKTLTVLADARNVKLDYDPNTGLAGTPASVAKAIFQNYTQKRQNKMEGSCCRLFIDWVHRKACQLTRTKTKQQKLADLVSTINHNIYTCDVTERVKLEQDFALLKADVNGVISASHQLFKKFEGQIEDKLKNAEKEIKTIEEKLEQLAKDKLETLKNILEEHSKGNLHRLEHLKVPAHHSLIGEVKEFAKKIYEECAELFARMPTLRKLKDDVNEIVAKTKELTERNKSLHAKPAKMDFKREKQFKVLTEAQNKLLADLAEVENHKTFDNIQKVRNVAQTAAVFMTLPNDDFTPHKTSFFSQKITDFNKGIMNFRLAV